jgi:hypothetical protein
MEDNYRKRMQLGQDGNALVQLVVINAVLFVILKFIYVIYTLNTSTPEAYNTNVLNWFVLPASLDGAVVYVLGPACFPVYRQYVLALGFWLYPAGPDGQP